MKFLFAIMVTLFLNIALYGGDFIPPPSPILTPPPYSRKADREIPRFEALHSKYMTPRQVYELALLNLLVGNYKNARELLKKTLEMDSHFSYALIQLGYLDLWENRYDEAYDIFLRELQEINCEQRACEGLRAITKKWAKEIAKQSIALEILYQLYKCDHKNPDTLLDLGLLLTKKRKWDEAKIFFKKCLEVAPGYKDAALGLANIYLLEKKWDLAKEIYEKYPEDLEAIKGLARIESRQGRFVSAESYYKKALQHNPKDQEARKEYARTLSSSWKFREAENQYALFFTEDRADESAWNESFNVRSHTRPSFLIDTTYTAAKENDPTLGVPVVRDFYLYSSAHGIFPASDKLLFDLKGFFYNQKEVNIYVPGINYNADLAGGQVTSQYLFKRCWRWDFSIRAFHAWPDRGGMNFPFKSTTRIEPGTSIAYNTSSQSAFVDVHVESFIIKNFLINKSQVLGLLAGELHYLFKPEYKLHSEIEASVKGIKLFDGNHEDVETFWLRSGIPYFEKTVIALYEFRHSHFSRLTANYFSYRQQFCNFLGFMLRFPLSTKGSFDLMYQHNWQLTKKLIQPIGNFIFIASSQLLTGNKITGTFTYRWKDKLHFSAEGHYFRDTLPYRDWNIKGSFLWSF